MALKIRIPKLAGKHTWASMLLLVGLSVFAAGALAFFAIFGFFYVKYQHVVDDRLKQPIFANTAKIYAAPREVRPGQKLSVRLIANELREAGYSADGAAQASELGTYKQGVQTITVRPGPQSYHAQDGAMIHISSGVVDSITDDHGQPLSSYELEPLLITGLSDDANRTKRRLLTYNEIPQNLINAVLAIEDRRFFEHSGVDYSRLLGASSQRSDAGAAAAGRLHAHHAVGARFLPHAGEATQAQDHRDRHHLPARTPLQQEADLRDVRQRDQPGPARQLLHRRLWRGLAGLLRQGCAPARPGRVCAAGRHHPAPQLLQSLFAIADRAIERRNLVLDSMVETGAITKDQAEQAKAEPLHLAPGSVDASEAPYFVDLVHDQLVQKLGDRDFNREGLRIYTSLDPDLQRVATDAVESTIHVVDEQVDKLHARQKKRGESYIYPQVALVALNPHTGQVLALVGGRSYGNSQLNHAVAKRPTGSIFKPFVYAAAFATAAEGTMLPGQTKLFSPLTMLKDEQTTYGEGTEYRVHAAQL